MDGKAKGRAAALTVLTLAAGTSVMMMFTTGGGLQPLWLGITAGGYVVVSSFAWWGAGALVGKKAHTDRFKMPVRPGLEAAAIEAPRREPRSYGTIEMPRRGGLVRPSSLAAASLPVEGTAEPEEIQLETEVVEPEEETPPQPQGYVFRGFTLYERMQKGKTVRLFSKKSPVGGGQPALLPEGYDVRWDGKHRRPVLVPPKVVVPEEPEAEPEPSQPIVMARPAAAPAPVEVAEATPKPCSAMTSPGVFCNNPAKTGDLYCARHHGFKASAVLEPKIEVTHDGAAAKGKAPKFAMPAFEVQLDRALRKPAKAKKPRTVELRVQADKVTHKPTRAVKARTVELQVREDRAHTLPQIRPKEVEMDVRSDRPKKEWTRPVRPRMVEVEIREAQAHEMPQTRAKEGRVEIREAQAHEMPQTRPREGRVEIREAEAHELPKTRPREGRVEIREAQAHELPKIRLKETTLQVRTPRAERKPTRAPKARTVTLEIHEDKVHMKPMQLSSAYDPTRAEVVTARGMPPGRKDRKGASKRGRSTELVVEKDSKKRSTLGMSAPPARRGRKS